MLSVRDLHQYAAKFTAAQFEEQLGPFVMVQAPPDSIRQAQARALKSGRTTKLGQTATPPSVTNMITQLEHLLVATLPNIGDEGFTVGRSPDSDLVVEDESVSKHHARISWDANVRAAVIEDLGSSNGTVHNGTPVRGQVALYTGDELQFGTVRFCYLLTQVLYAQLKAGAVKR
ncbi:MAG: FHA domain-containing protein [Myxococcaceae bacterium]